MIDEPTITVCGNLTADPELTMTRSGTAVATFTIASTPRLFDRASNRWRDGDALFLRCTLWRQPAEHLAELAKGTRVIATGRLKQHTFETSAGDKRTVTELEVDDVGPSLRFARVRVTRVRKGVTVLDDDAAGDSVDVVTPA